MICADRTPQAVTPELVASRQREWSDLLLERIEQISREPHRGRLSAATIARIAWAETAQGNPQLRRLLDTHPALVDAATRRREELLITVGIVVP